MARRVPLVSYWDTEDYLSPPDAGSDDIILHIARSARAAGLKATFCIMGEKVRSLVGRGRTDVIREIARYHDPLLHFNYGSIHPTTAEMLTTADWVDGVALTLAREAPGFRLLERTFGRCTGLTRHGMHYGAQILCACALERKAFWDSLVVLPETPFYWYCGALCFNSQANYALDTRYREPRFVEHLDDVAARLEIDRKAGVQLAALFGHPHRTVCEEFADVSYYGGRNALHEDLRGPRRLPPEEVATVKEHLALLFHRMARLKGFEVVTVADLVERYGDRPTEVQARDLKAFATKVLDEGGPVYTRALSAGEGLLALAEALVSERGRGRRPAAVALRSPLGPLWEPPERSSDGPLDRSRVIDLALTLRRATEATGHLPHEAPGTAIGLGSALVLIAEAYLDGRSAPRSHQPRSAAPWPAVAEGMAGPIDQMPHWPCHDPEMDVSRILRFCRLMSWTLTPASAAG